MSRARSNTRVLRGRRLFDTYILLISIILAAATATYIHAIIDIRFYHCPLIYGSFIPSRFTSYHYPAV
jgi:hypothetical protein